MRNTLVMSTVLLLLPAFCAAAGDGFGGVSARDAQGREFELVALSSEVDYSIGGLVAEARIRQRFTHHGDGWIDATYLLPLPEGAAVHDLQLHVGGRTVVGEIREKEQARSEFVEAAASGRRASLVETSRAQLFRTTVANVGPGETIEVDLRWWQPVAWHDGRFALTLPLTYTPRFEPAAANSDAPQGRANADDAHAAQAPTVRLNVGIGAAIEVGAEFSACLRSARWRRSTSISRPALTVRFGAPEGLPPNSRADRSRRLDGSLRGSRRLRRYGAGRAQRSGAYSSRSIDSHLADR